MSIGRDDPQYQAKLAEARLRLACAPRRLAANAPGSAAPGRLPSVHCT